MCMDINDVLPILDEKALEIAEQGDTNVTKFASTHVFGAKQEAKQEAKPSKKAAKKKAA